MRVSLILSLNAIAVGAQSADFAATAAAAPAANPVVDLSYSVYRGAYNSASGLNVFKGIRYAAPPTGVNRWTAPKAPATDRSGTKDATAFGPACPQSFPAVPGVPFIPGDEDCLFLNVYAPATASASSPLPVLVWIHGGGYGLGDGTQDMTEIINANNNGFIAVAIQYRLGAFGWLSSADVKSGGVVNGGLLDMQLALQWVQQYITKFGGDKTKVTISGESAGGGAVALLEIAKAGGLGTTLFRGGIAASPYAPPQYNYNAAIPTARYKDFAQRAGCTGSNLLACLRGKDSNTLQQANAATTAAGTYGTWAFLPVTDGTFVTTTISQGLASGKLNGVNMLVGNNANEGALFVPPTISTEADLKAWLQLEFPLFTAADIQQVLNAYPVNLQYTIKQETNGLNAPFATDVSQVATGQQQRANNIFAEATFVCPSYWLNDAYSGSRNSYHYQYSVPFASHQDDIPAYFGPAQPNQPSGLTDAFRKGWGEFVKYDSAVVSQAAFAKWVPGTGAVMGNLNTTGGTPYQATTQFGATVTQFQNSQADLDLVNAYSWENNRGSRCQFWRTIAPKVPN